MKRLLSTCVLVAGLSLVAACSTTKNAGKASINPSGTASSSSSQTTSSSSSQDRSTAAKADRANNQAGNAGQRASDSQSAGNNGSGTDSDSGTDSRRNSALRGAGAADGTAALDLADTTKSGNTLCHRSAYFDFDRSEVKPTYHNIFQAHARLLAKTPGAHALLQGNTDDRGSREYNLALGQRRADSVKQALVSLGAPTSNISTVSLGKESPRAQGDNEESWSINRRVDLLYGDEKTVPSCSNETP